MKSKLYWVLLVVWAVAVFLVSVSLVGAVIDTLMTPPPKLAVAPAQAVSAEAVPPRPYLTPEVERYMVRDNCTITKQRCRKDSVCETCMVCPYEGRPLLGWAATKCKSPTDCVYLDTNVDWEREDTNPGWCEGMEDDK